MRMFISTQSPKKVESSIEVNKDSSFLQPYLTMNNDKDIEVILLKYSVSECL